MSEEKRPFLVAVPEPLPNNQTGYKSIVVYASRKTQRLRNSIAFHYGRTHLARQLVSLGNIWSLNSVLDACQLVQPVEPPIIHQSFEALQAYFHEHFQAETNTALFVYRGKQWQKILLAQTQPEPPARKKRQRIKVKAFSTSN